ncbi:hypothetical protein AB0M86_45385 [Streptomyces sp. NPDC051639]|uniref:hypothetical protein n=1 Tax=Streptomyces sp. NPDC051639 TaxID=3155671 RepID=UPI00341892B5
MSPRPKIPPADKLTYAQHQGWACVYCGARLRDGVSVGRAFAQLSEGHALDIEVYACKAPCIRPTGRRWR